MRKIYVILAFFALTWNIAAQNTPTFKVEVSKNNIGINERVRIEFIFNENGDDFSAPNFEGFNVMGPSVSIRSSSINGVSSFQKSFTYILEPQKQGSFTIGEASIRFKNQVYTTKPIQIKVSEAVKAPSIEKTTDNIADEAIFVKAEISNSSPYVNQAVSLVYNVYVKRGIGVSGVSADFPSYPDFWTQDFPIKEYKPEEVTLNGTDFIRFTVKQVLLYPQKAENIDIHPIKVHLRLQIPTNNRDFFGQRIISEVNRTLSSNRQIIEVKALPEQGKPADFSGAVGDFTIENTLSKREIKAGDALHTKIQISGEGNFNLFEFPEPVFPSSFEVYEPETQDNTNVQLKGVKGNIVKNYTIIPSEQGSFSIPAVAFSFFNPKTKTYQSVQSKPITVQVSGGNAPMIPNPKAKVLPSPNQSADDFQYEKLSKIFSFSTLKWILWIALVGFVSVIFIRIWKYIQSKKQADIQGNKMRLANRLAKKYLSDAKKQMVDQVRFYESLERSLHNYLKAKLHIETHELQKDKIEQLLRERNVADDAIALFINTMKNCEFARYSSQNTSNMQADYQTALQVLSRIDKQIK